MWANTYVHTNFISYLMAKKNLPNQSESAVVAVTTQDVEARMLQFRGQYVLLDRDVAELYGVETKRINEAVKNNPKKFPSRYLFKLSEEETKTLAVEKSTTNGTNWSKLLTSHRIMRTKISTANLSAVNLVMLQQHSPKVGSTCLRPS